MTIGDLQFEVIEIPYNERVSNGNTHRLVACSDEGPLMYVPNSQLPKADAAAMQVRLNKCHVCAQEQLCEREILHVCSAI